MRLLLIGLILTAIFISCRKNGSYPAQLISTKFEITSLPRVYSRQGEVTDKLVAENYVKAWAGNYFFFKADTTINTPADTIRFETKDTLVFPHLQGLWGKRVVKSNGQYLLFCLPDTLAWYKRIDNVLYSIADNIGIVKPFHKDACPYIGANGPCTTEWVYDAYIATGSKDRLEFPLLTYKITRTITGSASGVAAQNYNNVFDPLVLSSLQDGDTLAIQTGRRVYTRID